MSAPQTPGPPPHPYASSGGNPGSGRRRGLLFGAIGAAVVLLVAAIVFLVVSNSNTPNNGGDKNDSSNSAEVAKPAPTTPANVTRWPANMATGSIVFTGDSGKVTVVNSEALPEGAQPLVSNLAPTANGAEPNRIQLYVDYRCPYCSLFEAANADTFEEALAAGDTVLELHPLAFLDKLSAGTYYSSRASGAMACVVDTQPEYAWEAHKTLLDPDFQPEEGTGAYTNEELIAALPGLNDTARSCITEERYQPFALELTKWVFANPVPFAKDPKLAVEGTPFAVVNGVPYAGDLGDGKAFRAFVEAQGITLQ